MINSAVDVEQWLRVNNLDAWEIKSKDADNSWIFETDPELSFEKNLAKFHETMSLCKSGRFIINAGRGELARKGRFNETFSNQESAPLFIKEEPQPHVAAVPTIPEGYISRSELDMILAKRDQEIKVQKMESELKELKEENKKLNEPLQKFFRTVTPFAEPVIGALISKFAGANIAVAGMPTDEPIQREAIAPTEQQEDVCFELSDEDGARLMNSLNDWRNADADFLQLIEKISQMAASGNPMYATAKNMLLNMEV